MICESDDALTRFVDCRYHSSVSEPMTIEEFPLEPELKEVFERARRNLLWLDEKSVELDLFNRYRGHYLAASEGELFVGTSASEVEKLAKEKHPSDTPHIRYIPQEKVNRIYAHKRPLAGL